MLTQSQLRAAAGPLAISALNAIFSAHSEELAAAFLRENIGLILLKGAAFIQLYPECLAQRPMSDIDILVKEKDRAASQRLLERAGYRPVAAGRSGVTYVSDRPLVSIDLHFALPYAPETEIWETARPLNVGSVSAMALSPAQSIIHSVYHMAVCHARLDGQWLRDIDLVALREINYIDWTALAEKAGKYRLGEACYYTFLKCPGLCATPEGESALKRLKPENGLRAAVFKRLLESEKEYIPLSDYLLKIIVHPSYCLKALIPEPALLRRRYPSLRAVYFVFYIFRPLLLAARGLRGSINFLLRSNTGRDPRP